MSVLAMTVGTAWSIGLAMVILGDIRRWKGLVRWGVRLMFAACVVGIPLGLAAAWVAVLS